LQQRLSKGIGLNQCPVEIDAKRVQRSCGSFSQCAAVFRRSEASSTPFCRVQNFRPAIICCIGAVRAEAFSGSANPIRM
jgi:hypothetical protein